MFEQNEIDDLFSNLSGAEKKHFMEVCYDKISAYPKLLLEDNSTPHQVRVNSVNVMIKFFEKEEEFEKCSVLKKLLNKLEHGRKNNRSNR